LDQLVCEHFLLSQDRYLVDVFALEFSEELGQSLVISINADTAQDLLDVGLRGRSPIEGEKEVSRKMLHFTWLFLLKLEIFRGREYRLEGVEVSKINLTRQGDNAQDQVEVWLRKGFGCVRFKCGPA